MNFEKTQELVTLSFDKKGTTLPAQKFNVKLLVDKSGSMQEEFDSGWVSKTIDLFTACASKFDDDGKLLSDQSFCYFNQKVIEGVSIPSDNRTGEGENDEYFVLTKSKLNTQAKTVEVFVVIHNAISRNQCMSMMLNGTFVIKDDTSGDTLGSWRLQDYGRDTAVHIATVDVTNDAFVCHTQGVSKKFEIADIYSLFKK